MKTPGSSTSFNPATCSLSIFSERSATAPSSATTSATAIYTKSHNGLIVNGAMRDVSGIQQIPGFRGLHARRRSVRSGECHAHGHQCSYSHWRHDGHARRHCHRRSGRQLRLFRRNWPRSSPTKPRWTAWSTSGVTPCCAREIHAGTNRRKWTPRCIEEFNAWLEKKGSKLRMPAN